MKQYYEKIEVNGKEDLPKETGYYIVLEKECKSLYRCKFNNTPDGHRVWLRDIDWYLLLPTSQAKDVLDAIHDIKSEEYEKIIEKQDEFLRYLLLQYGERFRDNLHIKRLKSELSELTQIKERKK